MLHFDNPTAFLFLLTIPLYYALRSAGFLSHITFPLTISDWGGKTFTWKSNSTRFARIISRFFIITSLTCVIIAAAEPVITRQEKVFTSQGTEIMFVVDTSPSMASCDMQGKNRLETAQECIANLTTSIPGASLGLITMSVEAALVVPVTMDHATFKQRLSSLLIGELGDKTAIGTGLSTAIYHLVQSNAPKKCIILLTDGENNAGIIHPKTAAELAKENDIIFYIIGIGTKGYSYVEYTDPKTGELISGYLESNFDERELTKLAISGGGSYFSATDADNLSIALAEISSKQSVIQSYKTKNIDNPLYADFLSASIILILISWIIRRFYLKELI